MKRKYFKFIEEDYEGNYTTYIYCMRSNLGAFKMLHKAFNNLSETSYRISTCLLDYTPDSFVDFSRVEINKNIRYINGLIDTFQLKKYLKDLEKGDDYFYDGGILKITAFFMVID